jgi:hypothetical protein
MWMSGNCIHPQIEIAGIGIVSLNEFRSKYDGGLYRTSDFALKGDCRFSLYKRNDYGTDTLNMEWVDIYYEDLNLNHPCTTLTKDFNHRYMGYYKLKPISYSWTGTCPQENEIAWKFKIDLIENKVKMYKDISEDKLGTLYATREMCEKANTTTIVTFDKPKEVEKIVSFEITLGVKVSVDSNEEDAIAAAMKRIRTCDDEILFDSCVSCSDYPNQE